MPFRLVRNEKIAGQIQVILIGNNFRYSSRY